MYDPIFCNSPDVFPCLMAIFISAIDFNLVCWFTSERVPIISKISLSVCLCEGKKENIRSNAVELKTCLWLLLRKGVEGYKQKHTSHQPRKSKACKEADFSDQGMQENVENFATRVEGCDRCRKWEVLCCDLWAEWRGYRSCHVYNTRSMAPIWWCSL